MQSTEADRHLRQTLEDRRLRLVAESFLNASLNSQQTSYTQSIRTPDSVLSDALLAGARHNGRMSNVRRFFCLFVTFDLLLTTLMWLICIMISGANVRAAFEEQIIHYQISTSLFDIVMAAACRFTILLLFYALLHLEHWFIVALSTTLTCALLLAKVFLYDWAQSSQPVFQVLLILTSFVLVWGEVWFLDIKVIPQEVQARQWFFGGYSGDIERSPLLGPPTISASVPQMDNPGHFYTPMDSPEISDDEGDGTDRSKNATDGFPAIVDVKFSPEKIEEYKSHVPNLLETSYKILLSNEWKVEKVTPEGDEIASMTLKHGKKIFRITGTINTAPDKLINSLYENIESSPTWNPNISEVKKIHVMDDNTDIVYQSTATLGKGAIGARDFIILRHRGKYDAYHMSTGMSVNCSSIPNRKHFVRAESGVSFFASRRLENDSNKCQFIWVVNTDLKGWIPQKIVDMSMHMGIMEFMTSLRNYSQIIRD
ncbi:steroidogenic acute regulatory protein-like [Trichogramma pretiosum]|uniref:steroidogenic acute regulatory protein-like n=1 Tax=Trichogramma pretiosum TaxID=7493 RepID=UPI0006C963DD|nr:steroidogenic acute regulatory protein-like [Trichogramma pretiosum]XP_014236369.1 steroidogenic acute regulatory protein-like [Trichogramma pretiosum]